MLKVQSEVNQNRHKQSEVNNMKRLFFVGLSTVSLAFGWGNQEMITEASRCSSGSIYFDVVQGCCRDGTINLYKQGFISDDSIKRFCENKETLQDQLYVTQKYYEKKGAAFALATFPWYKFYELMEDNKADEKEKEKVKAILSQYIDEYLNKIQEGDYSTYNAMSFNRFMYYSLLKYFPERASSYKNTMKIICDASLKYDLIPYATCTDVFEVTYKLIDDPKVSPVLRQNGINRKWMLSAIDAIFDKKKMEEYAKKKIDSVHEYYSLIAQSALKSGGRVNIDTREVNHKFREVEKENKNIMRIFDIKANLEDEILRGKE